MAKKDSAVLMNKQLPRLYATTIVQPSEYNLHEQMVSAIELANKDYSPFIEMDIGKVIGLYQAYLDLLEQQDE